jgi:replicative DNA helicase
MQKNIVSNAGAERAVLAGLAQYGKSAYIDVADIISGQTFTIESNQAFYKCIQKCLEESETADATSIIAAADTLGLSILLGKNKTDIEFVRSLFNFPIQLENVRKHAKQIAKLEFVRQIKGGLQEADEKLSIVDGTEPIDKIIAIPEDIIFRLTNELNTQSDNNPEQLGEGAWERLEHLANNPVEMLGIPTPWPIYNEIIGGGIRPGVAMIGARPKIGKSTLAVCCGLHVAQKLKIPVLYIDTEMNKQEQDDRIISSLTEISVRLLETGQFGKSSEYRRKVKDAVDLLKSIPFHHKWVGGKPFTEIMSIIRRWIFSTVKFDENGNLNPCLILYDYFKLMDSSDLDKMQEHQAIGFQAIYVNNIIFPA